MITVIIAGVAAAGIAMFGISHESVEQKQINAGKAIFESHGEVLNDRTVKITQTMILPMSNLKERDSNHLSYAWGNLSEESNNSIVKLNIAVDAKYFDCENVHNGQDLIDSRCVEREKPMTEDEWEWARIQNALKGITTKM